MPLKIIEHPITGQQFRLGRKPNAAIASSRRRLHLKDYVLEHSYPVACDYAVKALPALNRIYMNDSLGDCVIAGSLHLLGTFVGNSTGTALVVPNSTVLQLYEAIGGYRPGDASTDNGCDENAALDYWEHTGIAGHKIDAHINIDASDIDEVRTAIWLFEGVMSGTNLPDAWCSNMPASSGFTFDVAGKPNPDNGHCMVHVGYNSSNKTIGVSTWGMLGNVTDAAVTSYMSAADQGEMHAILSQDILDRASRRAPNGIDWDKLKADFASI